MTQSGPVTATEAPSAHLLGRHNQKSHSHGKGGGSDGEGRKIGRRATETGSTRVMSRADAEAFSKGGRFDRDLYHGTTRRDQVERRGYDYSTQGRAQNAGGYLGSGAYVTGRGNVADKYGERVTMRTNVRNPVDARSDTWAHANDLTRYVDPALPGGLPLPPRLARLADPVGGIDGLRSATADSKWPMHDAMRLILEGQGHDSAVFTDGDSIVELNVFRPENLVVVAGE